MWKTMFGHTPESGLPAHIINESPDVTRRASSSAHDRIGYRKGGDSDGFCGLIIGLRGISPFFWRLREMAVGRRRIFRAEDGASSKAQ